MIFCVRIISRKRLKLSTFQVNRPSASAKEAVSERTDMSAAMTSASWGSKRKAAAEEGAKSHQPWERFLEENRCQESRPNDLVGSEGWTTERR
jgi:hypothetical protein